MPALLQIMQRASMAHVLELEAVCLGPGAEGDCVGASAATSGSGSVSSFRREADHSDHANLFRAFFYVSGFLHF